VVSKGGTYYEKTLWDFFAEMRCVPAVQPQAVYNKIFIDLVAKDYDDFME
jgi:hypothetical protein